MAAALELEALCLETTVGGSLRQLVRGVSLTVAPGEVVALVGESGSGKSITCLACANLLDPRLRVSGGERRVAGYRITERSPRAEVARRIGMVFQNPQGSLNPVRRIGRTLADGARLSGLRGADLRRGVLDALGEVGIPDPARCAESYPHQLSGGQQQRVMIALATIRRPALIIADEPTTALDSTTQQRVLLLLRERLATAGALLVTHDLSVAAQIADRIAVMYHGAIIEQGPATAVLGAPLHPYTQALLSALPRLSGPKRAPRPLAGAPLEAGVPRRGCAFAPRCPRAGDRCLEQAPELTARRGHDAACWYPGAGHG